LTLIIAEAVRNGDPVAYVPLPSDLHETPEDGLGVSLWLDDIRKSYSVVRIELVNERHNNALRKRIASSRSIWSKQPGARCMSHAEEKRCMVRSTPTRG